MLFKQEPEIPEGIKTKISEVPVMNDKIINHLSELYGMPIMQVRDVIHFMGSYTRKVITDGLMETVMLPGFGKFAPNIKLLQLQKKRMREIRNRKYLLTLALKGKNINFVPQDNPITYNVNKDNLG